MTNPRIEKAKHILTAAAGDKIKMQKALHRISEMRASISIGREFAENVEDYINRTPCLKEFKEWTEKIVLNEKYEIVNF